MVRWKGCAVTVAAEEERARNLFDQVEDVEAVAETMDQADERRAKLEAVAQYLLAELGPVRPRIASSLLDISEKTVRAWANQGVLHEAGKASRTLKLDPQRLHEVLHIVRDLRAIGHDRGLLEAVWHRLSDSSLLEREDLAESLAQMRRGEGRVLRPRPSDTDNAAA